MVQIENVSFTYQEAQNGAALKDISVAIPKGQTVLVCGESGSGKTTFVKLLNGLIPHFHEGELKGRVLINQREVRDIKQHELAKEVGSVFQNPKSQFYTLNVDSEIVFACENLAMPVEKIKKRLEQTVSTLSLQPLIGKNLFHLSGGEKQRVACASVYMLNPNLIVLDEPTSNLDMKSIQELKHIVEIWKEQGKTIVIAEHRLEWLKDIVDRVLYFKDGKIQEDISKEDFVRYSAVELRQRGLRAGTKLYAKEQAKENEKLFKTSTETLKIERMDYHYKKKQVLDIPELIVPANAVVAILGDNGAGKTTFANCLCGLLKKDKSILTYQNANWNAKKRIKMCSMVMQDVNHQLFTDSVETEISLGTTDDAEEVLKELGLTDYKEAHPMSLSGGQKQRLAIACSLATKKEFLVYDEPTSGLDYKNMQAVARLMQQVSKKGKTQFIITHDLELVSECCNYFLYFSHGHIVRQGYMTEENVEFLHDRYCL